MVMVCDFTGKYELHLWNVYLMQKVETRKYYSFFPHENYGSS